MPGTSGVRGTATAGSRHVVTMVLCRSGRVRRVAPSAQVRHVARTLSVVVRAARRPGARGHGHMADSAAVANRRLSLRWFEPNTCHHLRKRPLGCGNAAQGPFPSCRGMYQDVSPRVDARQWLRTNSGQRRRRRSGAYNRSFRLSVIICLHVAAMPVPPGSPELADLARAWLTSRRDRGASDGAAPADPGTRAPQLTDIRSVRRQTAPVIEAPRSPRSTRAPTRSSA